MRKPRADPIMPLMDACVVEMSFNGTESIKIPTFINI